MKDLWAGEWTGTLSLQKIAGAGKVLVVASDAVTGFELYRTDGTSAGTQLFFNFAAGPQSPQIGGVSTIGTRLFMTVDDGVNGNEPWIFLRSALQ